MLYIPERYFKLPEDEFLICVTLYGIKARQITVDEIASALSVEGKRARENISAALNRCDFITRETRTHYSVSPDLYHREDTEHFARIYFEDVKSIMQSGNRNRVFLVKYYAWLMKTVNNKTNIGNQRIEYFSLQMECSDRTIMRANKQLEEIGVIYIKHSSTIKNNKDGSIYSEPNWYGHITNREAIDECGNKKNCSKAKELGGKISWLKRGKKYSLGEVQEMYDYAVKKNTEIMLKRKDGELVDMTVFNSYDIKRNEDYELFA